MGQYYLVVVGSKCGWNKQVYYPLDFDEGLKLMEHSYVDSDFCKKIHSLIYKNPKRIIWVGDYANEKTDEYYSVHNRNQEPMPKSVPNYKFAWGSKASHRSKDISLAGADIDYEHSYLVNHTIKSYIDLKSYYKYSSTNIWGVIDPLPILTVVGNVENRQYVGIVSCLIDGISSDSAGTIFSERGISVRTGLQCAPKAHQFLGTYPAGTIRFSVNALTRDKDFEELEEALNDIEMSL